MPSRQHPDPQCLGCSGRGSIPPDEPGHPCSKCWRKSRDIIMGPGEIDGLMADPKMKAYLIGRSTFGDVLRELALKLDRDERAGKAAEAISVCVTDAEGQSQSMYVVNPGAKHAHVQGLANALELTRDKLKSFT